MTFEAQIVIRGNNPQQLADDVQAVSEFLDQRRRGKFVKSGTQKEPAKRHLEIVKQ